jgi:MinD superfamily P-loop ATPase
VSGFHDIQRLNDLLELRGVKSILVINKCDLNPDVAEDMEKWAAMKGIPCAGKVAFSTALAGAVAEGEIPVTRSEVYPLIFPVWQKILEKLKDEK